MEFSIIFVAILSVGMCAPVRNADELKIDNNHLNRFRRSANLPVSPGTSLSAFKQLRDTVPNDLYSSKIEIIIKNYSKWLMSHLLTTSVEESL